MLLFFSSILHRAGASIMKVFDVSVKRQVLLTKRIWQVWAALCINCHQAGNIQCLPHSHIDQTDHTLLQPIAASIADNISFHLLVKSATSPSPAKDKKMWTFMMCRCLFLVSVIDLRKQQMPH